MSDTASVFDEETLARLNTWLDRLEQETTAEVAVVTVSNVETIPRQFTIDLFNHWGIGKAETDNGLLVVMVMEQRRLEMVTGIGLEPVLTDAWLGEMQREEMIPHFKNGDFATGLEIGLTRCEEKLRQNPIQARFGQQIPAPEPWPDSPEYVSIPQTAPLLLPLSLLVPGLGLGLGLYRYRKLRQSACRTCNVAKQKLSDLQEDAHLSAAQIAEEDARNIDWQVWQCPVCRDTEVKSVSLRTSTALRARRCPSCDNRTLIRHSRVCKDATYYRSGEGEVTESCSQCEHTRVYATVIPRRKRIKAVAVGTSHSRSTTPSSRPRATKSFGGGRSRGGGAGSSW